MKKRLITILAALLMAVLITTPALADDLVLENKNPTDWTVIEDGIQANLNYNPAGPLFNYYLTGTVGEGNTGYSLIYYADPWPGSNPGALIGTGASDSSGNIEFSGSAEFPNGIPVDTDANYPDGAKVWLLPSDCYDPDTNAVIKWQPGRYLFEYELITYQKTVPQPFAGTGPSWLPTPSTFTLRFGGQFSYNWIDGNTLPAIDQVSDGYWNGIPYTLRVVIPEGTVVTGGSCMQLVKSNGAFTFRNIDGTPITFSQPVTVYQLIDGEWVEIASQTEF